MSETGRDAPSIAMVIAADVIGGHEFQARALADDLVRLCRVTIYLNREEHLPVFESAAAQIEIHAGLFLTKGWLGKQVFRGVRRRRRIRRLLEHHDYVIVCGGTVEAGVCTSLALARPRKSILYLPSFYDRTVKWNKPIGCAYNLLLGWFGIFYKCIITINHIQARLIGGFLHRPTLIVPNLVKILPKSAANYPPRILCIGRLDRQKRIPELLRWLDFAENPFPEIVVIGDGPDKTAVLHLSASLQHIRVNLVGWKSPLEQDDLIGARDILILNSLIEGEPLVIREAHARGIAVLARNIVGIRGVTKKANRFNDQAELRQALQNLPEIRPVAPPSRARRERLILRAFKSITQAQNSARTSGYIP